MRNSVASSVKQPVKDGGKLQISQSSTVHGLLMSFKYVRI